MSQIFSVVQILSILLCNFTVLKYLLKHFILTALTAFFSCGLVRLLSQKYISENECKILSAVTLVSSEMAIGSC